MSISLPKCVKSISVVTMTLAKNPKIDIWPKQRFLRSLVGFLENVLSQHHFIRVLESYIKYFSTEIEGKLPIGELFLKAS